MFAFISGTLMNITQRFISVELGKGGDVAVLQKIFSTSMILHIAACVVIVILAETIGLWFLNNKLVIPAERMIAANWVYQFAVFGFLLSLLNAPLMALIVSHEDIHIYGYMGIFDVVVRLITVYLLVVINADKLIFLALFGFAVTCVVWFFYFIYCRRKYKYARVSFVYDKSLMKELGDFGKHSFVGSTLVILRMQGVNIMLNMFFGPAINAARGIANVVNTTLTSFGNNFVQALNPQLTKLYSANNREQMWNLAERGTRMTYFMLFIFFVPVLLKTEFILTLWLGNVPEYASIFTKLIFIEILLNGGLVNFSATIINATGKIKFFYNISNVNSIVIITLSYLACKMGYPSYYVFIIPILTRLPVTIVLFVHLKKLVNFSIVFFAKKAFIPIFLVSAVSIFPLYFANKLYPQSFWYSCFVILIGMLWTGIVIMFIGLRKNERVKIFNFMKQRILFIQQ